MGHRRFLAIGILRGKDNGLLAVSAHPGDNRIPQDANLLDLAFHDVTRLEIPRFGITGECRDAGNGARGNDIACAVAHRRIVGKDLRNLDGHLAGVRLLARLAVDAQLHAEIVRIWNLVGGDDPRTKGTESVDGFAETEDAGFHFSALNVAGGDVVENDITADVAGGLRWREVLAAFFEHDREL